MSALRTRKDPLQRFKGKVNTAGPVPTERPDLGRCAVWTAFTHDGYGRFWFDGANRPAHRWLWEVTNRPIPRGFEPDHLCRNRACVRLSHIEIVTQAENVRRGAVYRRGRTLGNAAIQAAKSACPAGHPYDEANTCHTPSGRRSCRACARARWHRRSKGQG